MGGLDTFGYVWIRLDTVGYGWIRLATSSCFWRFVWIPGWHFSDFGYVEILDTATFWIRIGILDFGHAEDFGYGWIFKTLWRVQLGIRFGYAT